MDINTANILLLAAKAATEEVDPGDDIAKEIFLRLSRSKADILTSSGRVGRLTGYNTHFQTGRIAGLDVDCEMTDFLVADVVAVVEVSA